MLSDAVAKLRELTGGERMPVLARLVGARSKAGRARHLPSVPIRRLPRALQASEESQASSNTPLSRQQTLAPGFLSHPFSHPTRIFHVRGPGVSDHYYRPR